MRMASSVHDHWPSSCGWGQIRYLDGMFSVEESADEMFDTQRSIYDFWEKGAKEGEIGFWEIQD